MLTLNDLKLEEKDNLYLKLLAVFSTILVIFYINFNINFGIYCSDVYIYLLNSLYFSGSHLKIGSTMYLSPVICFLTSLLFRVGINSELAIYIVTGLFSIVGNIGFYCFLRLRFKSFESFTGVIIFSCFSLNLLWLANGTLDIPSIALTIWAVYFLVLGLNYNSKFLLIAFPLFVFGFFTRYTVGFILPIMFLYFLSKKDIIGLFDIFLTDFKEFKLKLITYLTTKEFKFLFLSLLLSLGLFIGFINLILSMGSKLVFLNQTSTAVSGFKGNSIDSAYTDDFWFYLHDFPNFLSSSLTVFNSNIPILKNPTVIAYFLILIVLVVGLYKVYKFLKTNDTNFKTINLQFKNTHLGKLLIISLIIFTIFSVLFFGKISSIITIILVLTSLLMLNKLLKPYNIPYLDLNILLIAWFLTYFIFFTFTKIKVDRYIITVLPVFTYFLVLSLEEVNTFFLNKQYIINDFIKKNLSIKQKKLNFFKNKLGKVIPTALIIFFLISAFSFPLTISTNTDFKDTSDISNFLIDYDSDYENKNIGVYNIRPFLWYLKMPLKGIPSDETSKINKENITYYISNKNLSNITNYTLIKQIGNMSLYKK